MIGHDILAELSVANVRAHIEKIVRDIPTRLAGSEHGRRMAEYSAAALRSAGVSAVRARIAGGRELSGCRRTAGARARGIHHRGQHARAQRRHGRERHRGRTARRRRGRLPRLRGKARRRQDRAVPAFPFSARHEKQRIAALMGSAGAIMINWGAPESTAIPFGSAKSARGTPTDTRCAQRCRRCRASASRARRGCACRK